MTDATTELLIAVLTGGAVGSFLTLLTCWASGMFDPRSETADIDAFTVGVQRALNVQGRTSLPGRLELLESLLADITDECESVFVDFEDMSPEWLELTRRIREIQTQPPHNCPEANFTEHSPQLEAK